ncbi:MAG: FAD-binding protein, partial [Gemmatimonadaceae bacterium]
MTDTAAWANALRARLDESHLRRDVPLAPYTTFQIGGPADLLYDATSASDLASAIGAARDLSIPWFILGSGANVLIGDRGFRGLVIRNRARAHNVDDSGQLWSESGAIVQNLVLETVRAGWSGLEHYVGIPSTVGGALWQNLHFLSPAP